MTFAEIIAKARADATYDPTEDHTELLSGITSPLATKNTELLGKLAAAQATLKTLPEGFDVNEYNRLTALEAEGKLNEHKGDEKLEALRSQLTTAHNQALEAERATANGLKSALETQMLDNAARSALIEASGNPDLLLPHVRSQLNMVQRDDGTYAAVVVDDKGEQRFSVSSAGNYMDIPELVADMKTKDAFKPAFKAENGGGGGGQGSPQGAADNPWVKGAKFNRTEQAKILNSNPGLATTLQGQAEAANAATS